MYDKRVQRIKREDTGSWKLTRTAPNGDITEFDIEEMELKTLGNNVYYGRIYKAIKRPSAYERTK
jgi:hypothetical protein